MKTFSALLAICAGNSPVTGAFPAQKSVTRNFDVFFDLRLNKWLSKQSWGWWFETPSRPLWRHCDALSVVFWHNLAQNIISYQMEIDTLYAGLGYARTKVQWSAKWRLFRLDLNVLISGIGGISKAPIIRSKSKLLTSQNAPFELRHMLNPGIILHVSGKGIVIVQTIHPKNNAKKIYTIYCLKFYSHTTDQGSISNMLTPSNGNILSVTGRLWPVTGEFPTQKPATPSFDVFFDLCLGWTIE